jgi:drug/metabolite transporter (DMT)-like permease
VSARAWALFVAVTVIWGIPYLFIKVAIDEGVPPVFLAWTRVTIGAVVLLTLSWRLGLLPKARGRLKWFVAFAFVEIVGPFPLIAAGEEHVDSGLAAILIAAVPLFVAVLALKFDANERSTGSRAVGMVVGFVGVAALVGFDLTGGTEELLGAGALLLAALGYAIAPLLVLKRGLADLDSRLTMGVSLSIAALVLAPAAALTPPDGMPSGAAIGALVILGLVCTAGGLTFFGMLNAEVGPSRAVVIAYVCPIVAVGLGMVFLDERPGPGAVLGLAMILAGSWLATRADADAEAPEASDHVADDGSGGVGLADVAGVGGPLLQGEHEVTPI